ncbi:hypothetical protein EXS70_03875 [Candidatus Peribacteria bacterium]|nr:hypothetical protein [Candidatus Peribacteria bacterium]
MGILHVNEGKDAASVFAEEYKQAWIAAGKPARNEIDEVFDIALDNKECPRAYVHPLWVFMTSELKKNVPISWFSTHCPPKPEKLETFIGRILHGKVELLDRFPTLEADLRRMHAENFKEPTIDPEAERRQQELNTLCENLFREFVIAGCPSREMTEDTILSACCNDQEPPHSEVVNLWKFIRKNKSIGSIQWFLEKERALESIRSRPDSWFSHLAPPWEADEKEELMFRQGAHSFLQQLRNQPLPVRTKHTIRKDIGEMFAGILEEERASRETTP